MVSSKTCLPFSLVLVFSLYISCQELNTKFDCYRPTTKEDFEKLSKDEFKTAYIISQEKSHITCPHDLVRKINDSTLAVTGEYYFGDEHCNYDKLLIREKNGQVKQLLFGQLSPFHIAIYPNGLIIGVHCSTTSQSIYIAVPINQPDLIEEADKLAHYLVKNPDEYKLTYSDCKYQDLHAYINEREQKLKLQSRMAV